MNSVVSQSLSVEDTCQYPEIVSNVDMTLVSPIESKDSCFRGNGYLSLIVTAFAFHD